MSYQDSCEDEPIYGLPEELPEGERLLWQGEPAFSTLARRVFRLRLLALYFAVVLGVNLVRQYEPGIEPASLVAANLWMLILAGVALLTLASLAYAYATTTVYTLTTTRIVMRYGVALPMVINIPLNMVQSADVRRFDDGSGDVILTLKREKRVSHIILWPFVNPWSFFPAKPALRALPSLDAVSAALAKAAPSAERLPSNHDASSRATTESSDELLGAA